MNQYIQMVVTVVVLIVSAGVSAYAAFHDKAETKNHELNRKLAVAGVIVASTAAVFMNLMTNYRTMISQRIAAEQTRQSSAKMEGIYKNETGLKADLDGERELVATAVKNDQATFDGLAKTEDAQLGVQQRLATESQKLQSSIGNEEQRLNRVEAEQERLNRSISSAEARLQELTHLQQEASSQSAEANLLSSISGVSIDHLGYALTFNIEADDPFIQGYMQHVHRAQIRKHLPLNGVVITPHETDLFPDPNNPSDAEIISVLRDLTYWIVQYGNMMYGRNALDWNVGDMLMTDETGKELTIRVTIPPAPDPYVQEPTVNEVDGQEIAFIPNHIGWRPENLVKLRHFPKLVAVRVGTSMDPMVSDEPGHKYYSAICPIAAPMSVDNAAFRMTKTLNGNGWDGTFTLKRCTTIFP